MFGLKKDESPKRDKFQFDLEIEMKEHPSKGKKLIEGAAERMQEIKTALRSGVDEKDFDTLGILLHGYTALQKVLKKANQ